MGSSSSHPVVKTGGGPLHGKVVLLPQDEILGVRCMGSLFSHSGIKSQVPLLGELVLPPQG